MAEFFSPKLLPFMPWNKRILLGLYISVPLFMNVIHKLFSPLQLKYHLNTL